MDSNISNHQLHPLEINTRTGEPFLRLRDHKNIILTPPRLDDAPYFVPYLNDPEVYRWLSGPPFPYSLAHAEAFVETVKQASDLVFQMLRDVAGNPELVLVDDCPVRFIREVSECGKETFIGDICFRRYQRGELMNQEGKVNWENKEKWDKKNQNYATGDPNIIWNIGDFLAPSHHRRGIMTDAVTTLLHDWGVPRMGVRQVRVDILRGNEGSTKVFLKNGFTHFGTYDDHIEIRGEKRGLDVLAWSYRP